MNVIFDQNGLDGDLQGYARFTLELDEYDGISFAENDSITIGRPDPQVAGANQYLNPDQRGWSGVPRALKLASKPQINGDSAEFILQAAYMDQVDDGTYDIVLLDQAGKEKARGRENFEVMHSQLNGNAPFLKGWDEKEDSARIHDLTRESEVAESPAPLEATVPEDMAHPAEASDPDLPEDLAALIADGEESAPEEPESAEKKTDELSDQPAEPALEQQPADNITAQAAPAKKSQGGLMAAIAVILVLLVAGGAWFFMKNKGQAGDQAANQAAEVAKAAQEQKAAEDAARAQAEKKAADEAAARAEAEKAQAADPRSRVSKFFTGSPDPDSAMELAREIAPENSEDEDAVFRLYYYAAQNGNAGGAQKYAEAVDPAEPAFGTVKKNAAEAWRYYGNAEDGEAQARVRAWTEEHARAGNRQAREWLKEME